MNKANLFELAKKSCRRAADKKNAVLLFMWRANKA